MTRDDFLELRILARAAFKKRTMVQSMCEGKRRYESKREAERTIRRGKPICAFRCLSCHQWHIGAVRTARENRLALKRRREELCESQ